MLKKIALTGIFVFASAFSLSSATAVTQSPAKDQVGAPSVRPQMFCPNGWGCR